MPIKPGTKKGSAKRRNALRELEYETEKAIPDCPGKKKNGKACKHKAGFGTKHLGTGYCSYHGGNTPVREMAATKEQTLGMAVPIRVSPGQAMAGVLHMAAGQFAYVSAKVAELSEEEVMSDTGINRWIKFQRSIMHDLAKFAKTAADAGIDERMAKLAEEQTLMVAKLIEKVTGDPSFNMTPEQKKVLGPLLRKNLTLMQGDVIDGSAVEK